ncbi:MULTISPECIES: hypothetical protein [unclassified Streptomyces]|uniref:hypothetical protein n=1 Tax=unclassified Streptomyces TaxID=2593676 RepID=UPI00068F69A7|nr:hypothetical protein [Streptomyces sp. NRRL F-2747]
MTQRLRAQRWLAGAAVAAAALSPAAPASSAVSAASAAASSPAGRAAAVRPLAEALPGRAPAAAPKTDDADPDPVADVPHEAYEELAGSAAGVGRERPGRPAAEPANPETVLAARPLLPARPHHRPAAPQPVQPVQPVQPPPPPSPPPVITAIGTGPNERAADLAAHILPLGTGFALMGLGLGYLGLRLRKGL